MKAVDLLRRVHENEEGAVSLETILIVGAIALPILIFLITVAWPRIRDYLTRTKSDQEVDRKRGWPCRDGLAAQALGVSCSDGHGGLFSGRHPGMLTAVGGTGRLVGGCRCSH